MTQNPGNGEREEDVQKKQRQTQIDIVLTTCRKREGEKAREGGLEMYRERGTQRERESNQQLEKEMDTKRLICS